MNKITDNVWTKSYPLSLLGGQQGRVVSVLRLTSGKLIIHSTGPFTPADVAAINELGSPGWLVECMMRHDTFAKIGRAAFPSIPYLAPISFDTAAGVDCQALLPIPNEWSGEIDLLLIEGMPKALEHVMLHRPSRTLIVADLVFNFQKSSGWVWFVRNVLMGVKEHPDCARLFPHLIEDRSAYDRSVRQLLTWDFDRIIVGHNYVVESNGRESLKQALARKGMLPI